MLAANSQPADTSTPTPGTVRSSAKIACFSWVFSHDRCSAGDFSCFVAGKNQGVWPFDERPAYKLSTQRKGPRTVRPRHSVYGMSRTMSYSLGHLWWLYAGP